MNLTTDFYFKNINTDPNFRFSTNINFEYDLAKKSKVVKDILGFFEQYILAYEDKKEFRINRYRKEQ
ncbi:MAG: hypothetical protein KDH96_08130 [Candidatus Riesia sp.]|nr:hypothetical protein [Candidatus Dependentiae bacterium]MCB1712432.1 hypothetical protein [Candidatus Riesia sp.]